MANKKLKSRKTGKRHEPKKRSTVGDRIMIRKPNKPKKKNLSKKSRGKKKPGPKNFNLKIDGRLKMEDLNQNFLLNNSNVNNNTKNSGKRVKSKKGSKVITQRNRKSFKDPHSKWASNNQIRIRKKSSKQQIPGKRNRVTSKKGLVKGQKRSVILQPNNSISYEKPKFMQTTEYSRNKTEANPDTKKTLGSFTNFSTHKPVGKGNHSKTHKKYRQKMSSVINTSIDMKMNNQNLSQRKGYLIFIFFRIIHLKNI